MACNELMQHRIYKGSDNPSTLTLFNRGYDGIARPYDLKNIVEMAIALGDFDPIVVERGDVSRGLNWWDADLQTGWVRVRLGVVAAQQQWPDGAYRASLSSYDQRHRVEWISQASGLLTFEVQ